MTATATVATVAATAANREILERIMKDAAIRYPALGLSFGYIGNVYPRHDDRSWKIFTTLASWASRGACDVSFGGYGTHNLDTFVARANDHFEPWLAETQRMLDDGKLRDLRNPEPKIGDGATRR